MNVKAVTLTGFGFWVFRLKPDCKSPLEKGWQDKATNEVDAVSMWNSDFPVGIFTGKYGEDGRALVVVDIDCKNGKDGFETLLGLELEGFEFPPTCKQTTPSGGEHLIYWWDTPLSGGVNKLGTGLDVKSHGGYIVGAGSARPDGGVYTLVNTYPVAKCPQWIVDRLNAPKPKPEATQPPVGINENLAYQRGLELIDKAAPAREGEGGDERTYFLALKLKDLGVTQDQCSVLMNIWNEKCDPMWEDHALEEKIQNAYKYGREMIGVKAPETQFSEIESFDSGSDYIEELNKKYAFIKTKNGHTILYQTVDMDGNPEFRLISQEDFRAYHSNKKIMVNDKTMTVATAWMNNQRRKEYEGLCFKPEQVPKHNYFNLWTGFAVKPKEKLKSSRDAIKGFDMFMEHTFENVCKSSQEEFDWLMTYFAHMIQKPYEKPLVTVALKGEKGTGKNVFVDRMGALVGHNHYKSIASQRYLTSNFNSHMEACLLLCLDEAFWSGDKTSDALLKKYTTDAKIQIERKGKDTYSVDNYLRIVVLANADWVVPASNKERRYSVFQIGEGRIQDTQYFHKMRVLMDHKGGLEILMHELKNWDLSKVDHNICIDNVELLEQKISSLWGFEKFWYDSLNQGRLEGPHFADWQERIAKDELEKSVRLYFKENAMGHRSPRRNAISKHLTKLCPHAVLNSKTFKQSDVLRKSAYDVGTLEQCRQSFEEFIGGAVEWD